MNNKNMVVKNMVVAAGLLVTSSYAISGPYGYDLHNVLAPRSAGMAGTSIAEPLDNVSAVFGNPAGLSEFKGTEFTFGASWYKPTVELEHDGSVSGAAFKQRNGNEGYLIPQIAVTQDLRPLGFDGTFGAGLTAVSGIGAEFRADPNSLGLGAEFIIFGANFGISYDVTDNLSLGTAVTLSFAQMDLGLASTSQQTHDVSGRGSFGITYKFTENTKLGVMYQTELKHEFDDIIQVSPSGAGNDGQFDDLSIDQPQNIGIGISNRSLMGGNLYIAADVMWKNWANTDFWGDVFEDQFVFSVGAELKDGPWKFRTGYGYAEDPTKKNPTQLGGLSNVCAGLPSSCSAIPISTPVIQYLQAGEAEVIYKHRITAGVGYEGLLAPFLDLDMHAAYQFSEDRDYGTHTNAKVDSWHVGFAFTWHFE